MTPPEKQLLNTQEFYQQVAISQGGNIDTKKIGKCHKSELESGWAGRYRHTTAFSSIHHFLLPTDND